jgi:ribosomal protein RSM22 (predicted rRNA methylase)
MSDSKGAFKLQTSDKWLEELHPGSKILDPDGWDRRNLQYSYYEEEISEQEFNHRFMMSTVGLKPITAPLSDSKGAAIEQVLKDYRSQVANITQQYWDDAGTGVDTGVTTELLNQIDEEARQAILAILAQEVKRVIGSDENEGIYTDGEPDRDYDACIRNKLRAEQRRKAGLV